MPQDSKKQKLIVVLGMHRSGTSLLARGLLTMGVDLGDSLIGAIEGNNSKGFWEDKDLNDFDEEMLRYLSRSWNSVAPIDDTGVELLKANGFLIRAVELLSGKIQSKKSFGIKDPRVAVLLGFWQSAFELVDCDVYYIIALRNPLSVVRSLQRRDDLPEAISYWLWLAHTISAVQLSHNKNNILIDYDRLLAEPKAELERVSTFLGLPLIAEQLDEFMGDFIDEGLRHTNYRVEHLLNDPACPPIAVDAYRSLLAKAAPSRGIGNDAELQSLLVAWQQATSNCRSILNLTDVFRERVVTLSERNRRDIAEINALSFTTKQLEQKYSISEERLAEASEEEKNLKEIIRRHEAQLAEASGKEKNLREIIRRHEARLAAVEDDLATILSSKSWRLTAPIRAVRRRLVTIKSHGFAFITHAIYRSVPLPFALKRRMKDFLFRRFGYFFRNSDAYKAWFRTQNIAVATHADRTRVTLDTGSGNGAAGLQQYVEDMLSLPMRKNSDYVSIPDDLEPPNRLAARVIAFYLPQFHPVAENDKWWGRGFTEWTNVSKAVPQFVGHYQPHLPGELGFYDLRIVDVMRRQAELAKLYGVEGFCFHYYWFGGKRLLERPLEQLLNSNIDLPFCLCWANENWTRRWDGLESEILLGQNYSPEDDLEFIKSLDSALRDRRYIRIDGKPLLILYRPSLLPDAKATLERWRKYCRDSGIGEIFLGMVQFDKLDPREYGFDAAIEFPPHKVASNLPSLNDRLEIVDSQYAGYIIDYDDVVERSVSEEAPAFPLFKGLFPSWDNEARKPGRGFTVANSSPAKYQAWLRACVNFAKANSVKNEKVVFVNAWNEWAEGAHLEPDRRYGYAYLQATRNALTMSSKFAESAPKDVCIIIHAYYPDLLPEMLKYLLRWRVPYRLVVTTPQERSSEVRSILDSFKIAGTILECENRGRDILPFLVALRTVASDSDLILKLHTKKSLHRSDGEVWRKDMLHQLLDSERSKNVFEAFSAYNDLGMVAPEGHVLPLNTYWGANESTVDVLCKRMAVEIPNPTTSLFAAGSMFYVRTAAIKPIIDLELDASDFEIEDGQIDGTTAHAIERCFSIVTGASGRYLASSKLPMAPAHRLDVSYTYAAASNV
jgi:lipopolysaccharide biosynthesis protein